MTPTTGVVIFEGGHTGGPLGSEVSPPTLLRAVRCWTTLDSLEKFLTVPGVDLAILATDSKDLAREARILGAEVHLTDPTAFHFGRALAEVTGAFALDRVVCLGGGAVPLLEPTEVETLLELTPPEDRAFTANNVQSPDIVALGAARAATGLALPATDNASVFCLQDAGFERRLLPDTTTASFDLDTPTDVLFLAHEAARRREETTVSGGLGPRTSRGLADLSLDLTRLEGAAAVLGGEYSNVTLVGRVSGVTMNRLNAELHLRLRVFSEERGMKALGLIESGRVRSVLGRLAEEVGPARLVDYLTEVSDAVFWDTRVVLAHLGVWPAEVDRFRADLGQWTEVETPVLRELVRAASRTPIPIILGGHSVVSGGLRLLADRAAKDRTQQFVEP